MHWLLAGYMWLFIHRPFEVWPWLGEWRVERVYMLATIGYWLLWDGKGWSSNRLNWAFGIFFIVIIVAWQLSPYREAGTATVENYGKIAVFYVLLISCIRDERTLQFIVAAFLVCTALYMAHSLREYGNGRYVYRMGTARMIGVDTTLGDPNSFAASLVYALPMTIPFWSTWRRNSFRLALGAYCLLTVICVLLTGSRTGLVGLVLCLATLLWMSKYRLRLLCIVAIIAPLIWSSLPRDRQLRYLTLWDPSYGPANAQQSAEGRTEGWRDGVTLWRVNPLFGVGPGVFGLATGKGFQSHQLYGQVLGELGTLGAVSFIAVVVCFAINSIEIRRFALRHRVNGALFLERLNTAIVLCILLLLLFGFGGHNLYRFNWWWFGGFQAVALAVMRACGQARAPRHSYVRSRQASYA